MLNGASFGLALISTKASLNSISGHSSSATQPPPHRLCWLPLATHPARTL
jgi:hypothetical protein